MRAVFITNAGENIGGGHLSRCLALSQALETFGVGASWILNDGALVQAEKNALRDAVFFGDPFSSGAVVRQNSFCGDFFVVDSYLPGADFYRELSGKGPLVAIDDLSDRGVERCASAVINYGIGASRGMYESSPARFILGPRYALLRRDYWNLEPETGEYVFFVPGAADVLNAAETAIGLWEKVLPMLVVALGPLVPGDRRARVTRAAEGRANVSVLSDPPNFPSLLANAGAVFCSASVTAYEALAMRKKTAVFSVAQNQDGLGGILRRLMAAYDIGDWKGVSRGKIRDALAFCPDGAVLDGLVNGRGALECAAELVRLFGRPDILK
ncbi:MAG: hypothetical protein LBT31_10010 [Synergistaceae bacterium]|jgi:spore coat polysaccharide biosynthesis predicted glycosyltransferase SpsG|nr:hypothetical protein [Synergistaceae bacterium]